MKAQLTEKDNYMMMMRGEIPEWVPLYNFGPSQDGLPVSQRKVFSAPLCQQMATQAPAKDIWGVTYVATGDGAKMPAPNDFILDDITKWHDVIKAPDLSDFNWEMVARKDLENWKVDRSQTALCFVLHTGYFQQVMSMLGFNEGLCALVEEPEECQALFDYMAEFYLTYAANIIDYIKPDIWGITDDIATFLNPFISPDLYRKMLKPIYAKQAKLAVDRGIPIDMHCCGRCEDFIDDWLEIGVNAWQPAQVSNDLDHIKKKYGRKLAICGGYDMTPQLVDQSCPKELVVETVKKTIDRYAPDGGYSFCGNFLGPIGDPVTEKKNAWVRETVREYGKKFYQ